MKRILKIACILSVCVFVFNVSVMADTSNLSITKSSVKNNAKNIQIDNLGVKIYFNKEVNDAKIKSENSRYCKLIDESGKQLPTVVVTDNSEKKAILLLFGTANDKTNANKSKNKALTIKPKTKYRFVIQKGFKSNDGSVLANDYVINFKTLDPSVSMKISFGMMILIVIVMIFASKKAFKNTKAKEENKSQKVNPYKQSKKTGKSVEEIVEKDKKKKQKELEELLEEEDGDEDEDEYRIPTFKVKELRPISSIGYNYHIHDGYKKEAASKNQNREKQNKKSSKSSKNKGKKKK